MPVASGPHQGQTRPDSVSVGTRYPLSYGIDLTCFCSFQAASQTRDKSVLTEAGVGKVIDELRTQFDFVLCDSPAGIEQGLFEKDEIGACWFLI
jgi:hypothetical protein